MNPNVRFKKLHRNDLEAVIVHHSATPADREVTAKDIDAWHRERGWLAVGYHWIIRRDGCIEPGRFMDQVGAHAGPDWNDRSIGICMIGGLAEDGVSAEDNFTDDQYRSLSALLKAVQHGLEVKLHKDVSDTACSQVDLNRVS